jgi:hypothetical protein
MTVDTSTLQNEDRLLIITLVNHQRLLLPGILKCSIK